MLINELVDKMVKLVTSFMVTPSDAGKGNYGLHVSIPSGLGFPLSINPSPLDLEGGN